MKLKKIFSLRKGYLEYSFEAISEELTNDVVFVCKSLKRGPFVIEVFEKDPLNNMICSNTKLISTYQNFCYYRCDDVDFLQVINFADIRHLCIYSIAEISDETIDVRFLRNHFAFCVCFENYLDTCQLLVSRKCYIKGDVCDL